MSTTTSPYISSHLGVYALILNPAKSHILLIKKARGPYTGLLDLPGGTPEPIEMLEETVEREVLEETGCTVTHAQQLAAVSCLYPYKKEGQPAQLRHIGILYRCKIQGTPMQTPDGLDSNGCIWVPLNQLTPTNATPFVLKAAQVITHRKK